MTDPSDQPPDDPGDRTGQLDAGPLAEYAGRWEIAAYPAGLEVWTATRRRGNETRAVVASTAEELAAKLAAIVAAEREP
jgi:hypothetical protein